MASIARLAVVSHQPNLEEVLQQVTDEVVRSLMRLASLRCEDGNSFADFEGAVLAAANEGARRCLQERLQTLADSFVDEVRVGGVTYSRHQPGKVTYHSLCGDIVVERHTYRRVDVRNGATVVPVELSAGLMQQATPAMAFAVAQGFAQMPSRHLEAQMQAMHRCPPSRSTLERLGHDLGGAAKQDVVEIEEVLRKQERLPAGAHAISIGLDRTTTPMIEERPPTQQPNTPRKRRRKPYARRPPHPFDVVYRMAYVGTFAILDDNGEALLTRRYGATHEEGPDEIVKRVMADVMRAREQHPDLPVVIVQDGAPELWGLLWDTMRKHGIRRFYEAIDRFHLNERLANTLAELEKDEAARQKRYATWQQMLDHDARAIDKIFDEVERDAHTTRRRTAKAACWSLLGYINGNQARMRYAKLRRLGLPIASGVTEGACKSLITMRFKRSGQRWYHDGLTAALTLRALLQSERLPAFWVRFSRRYSAKVSAA